MTAETPKPKRKRWRWIIAGVLLLVWSVIGWWYWPCGDARFVGKWAMHYDPADISTVTLTLESNGIGWIESQKPKYKVGLFWRTGPGTLVLGTRPSIGSVSAWRRVSDFYFKLSGNKWLTEPQTATTNIAQEEIALTAAPPMPPVVTFLRRVPAQ